MHDRIRENPVTIAKVPLGFADEMVEKMVGSAEEFVVGVLSDTHGLIRPSVVEALQGVDLIVHAGDIGGKEVVRELELVAPVRLVRGNTDLETWSITLPETDLIEVGEIRIYMLHDLSRLAIDPQERGVAVVVTGHSHKPHEYCRSGVLYFNPGSAGPRRFSLPISAGRLVVKGQNVRTEHLVFDE